MLLFKKLAKSMTKDEIENIKFIINNMGNRKKFGNHALDMMKQRGIRYCEVREVFKDYEIIEFHRNRSNRVLLRGQNLDKYNNSTCLVLDLNKKKIITVYKNSEEDCHKTLNEYRYYNDKDIIFILENIIRDSGFYSNRGFQYTS